MPTMYLATEADSYRDDTAAALWTSAERLRQSAARGSWRLDAPSQQLLDHLLMAAAQAEQQITAQQARIRYLESLSVTDELTGLANRRGFRLELDRAMARAKRRGETGLLLLCDLDHFKSINDTYGHSAGDTVLQDVANLLHLRTRKSDCVARLGGDEFAVLITDTPMARAERLADKLHDVLSGHVTLWRKRKIPVSASLGCDAYGPDSSADSLLFRADQALYMAKRARPSSPPSTTPR